MRNHNVIIHCCNRPICRNVFPHQGNLIVLVYYIFFFFVLYFFSGMAIYTKFSERKCLHCIHLSPGHCYCCFSSELLLKIILVFRTYRELKTSPSVSKAPGSLLLLDVFRHIKALSNTEATLSVEGTEPTLFPAQSTILLYLSGPGAAFSEGLTLASFPYTSLPVFFLFNFILFLLTYSSFTMFQVYRKVTQIHICVCGHVT